MFCRRIFFPLKVGSCFFFSSMKTSKIKFMFWNFQLSCFCMHWLDWFKTWIGAFSRFLSTCIDVNWKISVTIINNGSYLTLTSLKEQYLAPDEFILLLWTWYYSSSTGNCLLGLTGVNYSSLLNMKKILICYTTYCFPSKEVDISERFWTFSIFWKDSFASLDKFNSLHLIFREYNVQECSINFLVKLMNL